jgi:transcriptional regulator with XRE-family HTH domain
MRKKKKSEPIRFNRLKIILVQKNISQTEFAEMVGRERNSITRICNNITQHSLKFLYEMSYVLNIDVRDLLTPPAEIKDAFLKDKKKGE